MAGLSNLALVRYTFRHCCVDSSRDAGARLAHAKGSNRMATVRGGSSLSAPWLRTLRLLAAAILILTLLGPPGSRPASAATNTYYFHGPATAPQTRP